MKKLKFIFHALYFAYILLSILLFTFRDGIAEQMNQEFLERFINFWVILGFSFLIAIWIIQAVHIGFLKKDINEMESEITALKSKLYDFTRVSPKSTPGPSKTTKPSPPKQTGPSISPDPSK